MLEVAGGGAQVAAILRQPWALTLWTFHQLQERDRLLGKARRLERADNAVMLAWAVHEPDKIASERQAAQVDITQGEVDTSAFTAEVEAFLAELDAGRVMEDS